MSSSLLLNVYTLAQSPAALPAWVGLGCALAIATVTDLRSRRIPNALTLPTTVVAVLLHGLLGTFGHLLASFLAAGLWLSLGLWYWIRYRGQGIGAGDVKMVMACGALLGVLPTFWIVLFSNGLQLAYLLAYWLYQGTFMLNLRGVGRWLLIALLPGTYKEHYQPAGKRELVPHAPFMLLGAGVTALLSTLGILHI